MEMLYLQQYYDTRSIEFFIILLTPLSCFFIIDFLKWWIRELFGKRIKFNYET